MYNHYSMTRSREAGRGLFRVQHNRAAAFEPQNAIFPDYQAPISNSADGERELVSATWGNIGRGVFLLYHDGESEYELVRRRTAGLR